MTARKAVQDVLSIDEMLAHQTRPQMVVPICVRGDLTSEIYRLDAQLVEIGKKTLDLDTRLTGDPEAKRIAARIRDLEAEAMRYTIPVTVGALPKLTWAILVGKHPSEDKGRDFDDSIYNDAIPACIIEPKMTPEQKEKFLNGVIGEDGEQKGGLSQGQWDELAGAVHALNAGDGAVPFSRLASRALQGPDGK